MFSRNWFAEHFQAWHLSSSWLNPEHQTLYLLIHRIFSTWIQHLSQREVTQIGCPVFLVSTDASGIQSLPTKHQLLNSP